MTARADAVAVLGLLCLMCVIGCARRVDNPDHCFFNGGDAACEQGRRCFVSAGCNLDFGDSDQGCFMLEPDAAMACYRPCGDQNPAARDPGSCAVASTSSDSSGDSASTVADTGTTGTTVFATTSSSGGQASSESTGCPPGECEPIACSDHADCTQSACDFFANPPVCFRPSSVAFVSTAGRAEAAGTREDPLASIAQALERIDEQGVVLLVADGEYRESVTVPQGTRVAIGGVDGTARWSGASSPTIARPIIGEVVAPEVSLFNLDLSRSGDLVLDAGIGVYRLDRVQLHRDDGIAAALSLSDLLTVNTFISGSGPALTAQGGQLRLNYTTVYSASGAAIDCSEVDDTTLRNSLLMSEPLGSECSTRLETSRVFADIAGWFINPGQGDLHLSAEGSASLASPTPDEGPQDPLVDIDEDSRLIGNRIGADRPAR